MKALVLTLSFALLATACEKSGSKESADGGMMAATTMSDAGSPATAAAAASALVVDAAAPTMSFPSPARAERKAEKQITKANYKSELDKIDREVGP